MTDGNEATVEQRLDALAAALRGVAAAEEQKARRLVVAAVVGLTVLVIFGAAFIGIALANRATLTHMDDGFDGLTCFAAELGHREPPPDVVCKP